MALHALMDAHSSPCVMRCSGRSAGFSGRPLHLAAPAQRSNRSLRRAAQAVAEAEVEVKPRAKVPNVHLVERFAECNDAKQQTARAPTNRQHH